MLPANASSNAECPFGSVAWQPTNVVVFSTAKMNADKTFAHYDRTYPYFVYGSAVKNASSYIGLTAWLKTCYYKICHYSNTVSFKGVPIKTNHCS